MRNQETNNQWRAKNLLKNLENDPKQSPRSSHKIKGMTKRQTKWTPWTKGYLLSRTRTNFRSRALTRLAQTADSNWIFKISVWKMENWMKLRQEVSTSMRVRSLWRIYRWQKWMLHIRLNKTRWMRIPLHSKQLQTILLHRVRMMAWPSLQIQGGRQILCREYQFLKRTSRKYYHKKSPRHQVNINKNKTPRFKSLQHILSSKNSKEQSKASNNHQNHNKARHSRKQVMKSRANFNLVPKRNSWFTKVLQLLWPPKAQVGKLTYSTPQRSTR